VADRTYADGFRAGLEHAAQLAEDHGAVYWAEVRPCPCPRNCGLSGRPQLPFADVLRTPPRQEAPALTSPRTEGQRA
jgi:hypothetical protein